MVVPLEWRVGIKGSGEVKSELDDLSDAFNRAKQSGMGYAREQRALSTAVSRRIGEDRLQNRLLLAQHPSLLRISRGLSTVTSITRTLLTISNALNLSKISGQVTDTNGLILIKDRNELQRELNELEAKGLGNSQRALEIKEELNIIDAQIIQNNKDIDNATFDNMVTSLTAAVLAISSVFNLLIKNKTILKALTSAGSFFGSVFGGFFTFAAKISTKVSTWLLGSVASKDALAKAGSGGALTGTAWGTAFAIAAGIAAATAAVLLIDALGEVLTGHSTIKRMQEQLGVSNPQSALDILGGIVGKDLKGDISPSTGGLSGAGIRTPGHDPKKNIFKEEDIKKQVGFFDPLLNLFRLDLPEAMGETDTAINEAMIVNIPTTILESTPIIKKGFIDLWNGIIGVTNSAGGTIVSAVNSIFTSLIAALNSAIRAYNRAARRIGRPTVGTVEYSPTSFIPIPMIAAAKGFEGMINQPTMFLTGENGPEHVSVTPNGGGRNGGGNTMYVTVQGSILSERQLFKKLDDLQKQNLKGLGFTGY